MLLRSLRQLRDASPCGCLRSFHFSTHTPPSAPLSIGSPARIRKLIAGQRDPLLAKEILELSCSFLPPKPSHLQTLILKLARARRFSVCLSLIHRLPSPPSPSLLSTLAIIFSRFCRPDLSLVSLRLLLRLHSPHVLPPRLLRRFLSALSSHPSTLPAALSLLQSLPDIRSHNLVLRDLCRSRRLSLAIPLFNRLNNLGLSPDPSSYRFLIQGLCRHAQLSSALSLFEEMLNRGLRPDSLTYTTLLNALCRKKKLCEAYKILCRMRLWGCAPDIFHFNTLITGFCREGLPLDACKLLDDMLTNGLVPNLVSYTSLINGLCAQGELDKAYGYLLEMLGKNLLPHFSIFHALVRGFCSSGKNEEGCGVVELMLKKGVIPHVETWMYVAAAVCVDYDVQMLNCIIMKTVREDEWKSTRVVQVAPLLDDVINRLHHMNLRGTL
ncbi:hypothetical protein HPP92_002473 [Vanilla planifolia]|uniref:Pentatricopeptide repeat-containing protein n=1 Tax=Vanilla planifolia TaxID=51239 RepID=A0A835VGB7_VANPL|nr:hypothetical protein HPP92_002473 [Vanilla planifolia]